MNRNAIVIAIVSGFLITAPFDDAWARSGGRSSSSGGSHSVKGYTNKNGTYVALHRATNPNGAKIDNWSTKGNTNPYTGKPGTKPAN